ncbi:MAG TPA: TerB family tellurite resistance protein [Polyangiaceae bacterium]|nr:TerB family tellurite resistance protein [Polyangiaceae bacterium]
MALILPQERLEELRRRLQASGRRPSMLFATTSPAVLEAIQLVEEFGPMCEALYLVMVADGRLLNVEREVLRGALDVLSAGRIRTAHMESMLDNAARRIAEHGAEALLNNVIGALEEDPARAEATVVLAIAVAAADGSIVPEEQLVIDKLAAGLDLGSMRGTELLEQIVSGLDTRKNPDR